MKKTSIPPFVSIFKDLNEREIEMIGPHFIFGAATKVRQHLLCNYYEVTLKLASPTQPFAYLSVGLASRARKFKFSFWSLLQVFDKMAWILSLVSVVAFGGFLCLALCLPLHEGVPKQSLINRLFMSFWLSYSIFIGENVPLGKSFAQIRHIM